MKVEQTNKMRKFTEYEQKTCILAVFLPAIVLIIMRSALPCTITKFVYQRQKKMPNHNNRNIHNMSDISETSLSYMDEDIPRNEMAYGDYKKSVQHQTRHNGGYNERNYDESEFE